MALSGSFNTNKYNSKIGLTLSWTATQSIANNTTTIKWTLKSNGGGSGNWWYAGPVTVVIAGKTVLSQTSRFKMYGSGAYKKTGSLTVSHNNDGTKSVSMSVKAAIYSSSVNCTGSHSYTLNTIPRYASLVSVSDFNDTGFPTIVYENKAGTSVVDNVQARLTWQAGGVDYYSDFVSINDAGGTYTFNSTSLPQAQKNRMLNACRTASSLSFKVDLQSSVNGTVFHDYKEAVMHVVDASPTAVTVSYRDATQSVVAITGDDQIIVQGQSGLVIGCTASTGQKQATISSYVLKFGGNYYDITNNRYYGFPNVSLKGDQLAMVVVTDSRGFTSHTEIRIPILEWSKPTLDYAIARKNSFEDTTYLTVNGHISSVTPAGGTPINTMLLEERYQQKGAASWSSWATLTSGQTETLTLDNSYEWNVQIRITDAFTSNTYSTVVPTGRPLMIYDIKRKSIGINSIPDADNQLYVGGNIKTSGGLECFWINVRDITSSYIINKTSGAWSIYSQKMIRCGNIIQADFVLSGDGTAVAAGTDGYVGTIAYGAKPQLYTRLIGMAGQYVILGYIDPSDSSLHFRPVINNYTLPSTGRLHFYGIFITQ